MTFVERGLKEVQLCFVFCFFKEIINAQPGRSDLVECESGVSDRFPKHIVYFIGGLKVSFKVLKVGERPKRSE